VRHRVQTSRALPGKGGEGEEKQAQKRESRAAPTATFVGGEVAVERVPAIVLAPPLHGTGWLVTNGCCDAANPHRATLRVHASGSSGTDAWDFPPMLSSELVARLLRDQSPAKIPIRYDPTWPGRTWVEGVPDDENGLFYTSLFVHFGQGVSVLLITLIAWDRAFAPTLGIWLDYGGWPPGEPRHQVAIEPTTSADDDLASAIAAGRARILEPGTPQRWKVRLELATASRDP